MERILTKIFYIVFQVLKVLLIKICKIQSLDLLFLFLLAFTSADIIFHKFLELHSTLSEKKFSLQIFFFNRFTETPYPLKNQNLLSMTKVFCQCSLTYHGFSRLLCYDDDRKNQNSRTNTSIQLSLIPGRCLQISPWIEVSQKHLSMVGKLLQEPHDAVSTLVNEQNIFCSRW